MTDVWMKKKRIEKWEGRKGGELKDKREGREVGKREIRKGVEEKTRETNERK